MIYLGGIRFYLNDYQLIPHHHPDLIKLTAFVWVIFEGQKNRLKYNTCTKNETHQPFLCQVIRLSRAVQCVLRFVKDCNKNMLLCTFYNKRRRARFITQEYSLTFIRKIYHNYGRMISFRFHPEEIRNRSIQSRAVIVLFLNNHSIDKIMILGQKKSKALLYYI